MKLAHSYQPYTCWLSAGQAPLDDLQLVLQSNDCGCVIYECTVNSEGTFTWKGSAFDCPSTNNEIILFFVDRTSSTCNDGAIKAQRNNYTSQLIITNSSLSGSSIECSHVFQNGMNLLTVTSIPNITTFSGRCNYFLCYIDTHTEY